MGRFKELKVWQKSMDLVVETYKATSIFPQEECYGLTAQIRRSAISIPSNIAEGNGRRSRKEYLRFISIASGSLAEIETQILLSQHLVYLPAQIAEVLTEKIREIGRMLIGLRESLESDALVNRQRRVLLVSQPDP
ncbi:MAG: four helix bundle protein [Acidobacteria bacterium]|nr:four helix bundle protein [Acidobacteriota bacterium]